MDAQTKRAIDALTQELLRTQAELATVKRGQRRPQLGNSSIDTGSLEVRDSAGVTRLRLGWQPDGSVGVVEEGGDPHPAPGAPMVEPIPSGLSVTWDGSLDGLELLPADFDHINVHVSTSSGFTPGPASFAGTIPRSGGSLPVAPLEVGTTYYVRLVPVGTGGVQGAPSAQASGVPVGVTDIEPGSITETEIADDAITSPKISANAVQALHIAADQIEAGHIQAAAVTAAKLEADLVLGTRIIAGNPMGARVELDSNGLRGYTGSDELAFVIDDEGNATFSGSITGSEITGSRMTITTPGGATGVIEGATGGVVRSRVTGANGSRVQMVGTPTLSQLAVWANTSDPTTPSGAITAQPGICAVTMYSDASDALGKPSMQLSAATDEAAAIWRSETGSEVRIRSVDGWSSVAMTAPEADDPDDEQGAGFIFTERFSNDLAALSLQGPVWNADTGPEYRKRAVFYVEGARPTRAYTRMVHQAQRHRFGGESLGDAYDTTSDGLVELAPTHSIMAPKHGPVRTDMAAQPTATGAGQFVNFTGGQYPTLAFRTGWSGRVRVTIQMCGFNHNTNGGTLAVGFSLTGGSTVPTDLARAAMVRSIGTAGPHFGRQSTQIVYLNLAGNANYTLQPAWRTSSLENWTTNQAFDLNYQNSIVVEPLM